MRNIRNFKKGATLVILLMCAVLFTKNNSAYATPTAGVSKVIEQALQGNSEYDTNEIPGVYAGVTKALMEIHMNVIEEQKLEREREAQKKIEKKKAEKERKKKLAAKKKEAARKAKEQDEFLNARYEIYDARDGKWHHMDYELQDYLRQLCIDSGIRDKFELMLCQFYIECGYREGVVSSTGDHGMAQINECNFGMLRNELGITDFDDSKQSLKCGVYIMQQFLSEHTDAQALSRYNTGRPYNNTAYSRKVLGIYNNGKGVRRIQ